MRAATTFWGTPPRQGRSTALARFFDHVYFSAVVYTTLGFGEMVPTGALRFLVGVESLAGLALITGSASFTFIKMQKFWRSDPDQ